MTEFNGEQGNILYCLWETDGISSTDISMRTGLAINTLTGMLETMENEGLIYREKCDRDRRKKYVFLTEKGKSLEKKSRLATDRMDDIFYRGFSDEDIENFENMLSRIISNLEEDDDR